MKRNRTSSRVKSLLTYGVVLLWVAVTLFPIFWILDESLKIPTDVFAIPPKWFSHVSLANYRDLFSTESDFGRYLGNSFIVTIASVALGILVGLPAAYALTFLRVRRKSLWMLLILLASMLPPITLIIPLYEIWQDAGMIDTYPALIVTYTALTVSFVIWMLRGFLVEIPRELIEAARVDGSSHLGILVRIVLPLVRSGIAATSVFTAIFAWNELLVALVLTTDHARVATAAIASLITDRAVAWGRLYAAGTLVVVPVVLFALAVQKHIVRGFTWGAVKG